MATVDVVVGLGTWSEGDEGVVVTWQFRDGATVSEGSTIVEVMQEKVQIEIEAPASGTLKILAPADEIISHGTVIATIETE